MSELGGHEFTNALTGLPIERMDLNNITRLAIKQITLERAVEMAENVLEDIKSQLHDHSFRVLPEAMRAIGLESFTLDTGESISIKEVVNSKLPDAKEDPIKRKAAFEWLRENKHDGIIKSYLNFQFDRGSDKDKQWLLETVRAAQLKVQPVEKDDVHWQTLRAFVKEMIKAGTPVPQDLFGVFIGTQAKVEGVKPQKAEK